jgi:hypothetical protein
MQEKLKKEIKIKFTIESQDAVKALEMLGKGYSSTAEKSAKFVTGNNEVSKSLAGISGTSFIVNQAFAKINTPFDKPVEPPVSDSTSGNTANPTASVSSSGKLVNPPASVSMPDISAGERSGGINEYENARKKYKNLSNLAAQYSDSIHKIDEQDEQHKLKITGRTLKSVEGLLSKHTTAYKAFVVASTLMDTFQAAEAAYKSAAEIPLVGFIMAPAVAAAATIAGMQIVNKVSAVQVPGYAKGGAVIGENGPEIIAPFQDYASGQAKLITMTMLTLKNEITTRNLSPMRDEQAGSNSSDNFELLKEMKQLNKNFEKHAQRPLVAKAYLDDREAKKIYNRGSAINNKSKI